jgi:hypothetical protein
MQNDGTRSFDHGTDGYETKLGGCSSSFRNLEHPTAFSLVYLNRKLTLSISVESEKNYVECFTTNNINIPDSFYIGFSAATGGVSDIHDILYVRTISLDEPSSKVGASMLKNGNDHYSDEDFSKPIESSSGLFSFLKNLLIAVMVLFIVYVIWVYYQSTKTQSYKRF